MAFYEDKRWLLKHIRHSFITGDESQLCEHVLLNNDFPLPKSDYDSDDDQVIVDDDLSAGLSDSPEIVNSTMHRPRTYTAIRLEKIKRDREECCGTKTIVWSLTKDQTVPNAELDELFAKRESNRLKARGVSQLSSLLSKTPAVPPNPFAPYARFDGAYYAGDIVVKKIKIFLTILPPTAPVLSLEISVVATAKISDLIGLICWQYTSQIREPHLPYDSVDAYKLLFAEEDGEFDFDFPCLEKSEVVSKFQFSCLALVSSRTRETIAPFTPNLVAKVVVLPSRDLIEVVLPNGGIGLTVSDLIKLTELQCTSKALANRLKTKTYVMRDKADPNNALLSLNAKLLECRSRDFVLAPSETRTEEIRMRKHLLVMEAALYESYSVSLLQRMRGGTEIHLGISGDKIEVNPVSKSSGFGLLAGGGFAKPVTYNMDSIADCSIVEEKYGRKSVVRLVHRTPAGEYKNLDFECNHDTARTIDQKCKHILNLLSSVTRQEYLEMDAGKKSGKKGIP
ncbi:unnamed protein product [Notodromas monacha]|uniref:Stress-activated map kinase-interacting protein 1 n=1 Tax=Notodromas monacha TaxID=399045 RepID=A0A7R9GD02_9CRUS|nr:unnamed protein product [Notodromas monacha]CAG0916636.1 unnamed protein product [Notodromas monacha]